MLFCKLCLFFFIVWHRRLKNQKTPKEGLTVLVNEDKELAELRGVAAGVGLANACYAIQCVTSAVVMGHGDEEWAGVSWFMPISLAQLLITHPPTLRCDLGWMANDVGILRKTSRNQFSSIL